MTGTPVPDLAFDVTGVEEERHAALPTLRFGLDITRTGGAGAVAAVALTVAVRIDVRRRRYEPRSHRALAELFGPPDEWASAMQPLAWARSTVQVPGFEERTSADIPVECSYDTELAVTKYFRAAGDADVPLDFLFSGTVFHQLPGGGLGASRISWARDVSAVLPAGLWHRLMDRYHLGGTWLRVSRTTHDRLDEYRARRVLGSAEDAVRALLDGSDGSHGLDGSDGLDSSDRAHDLSGTA